MKRLVAVILTVVAAVIVAAPSCRRQAPVDGATRPRIVSFCPAITRMMFEMGLEDHLVAVTTQDVLPAGVDLPVVGDAFTVNSEGVINARPDALLTNVNVEHFAGVRRLDPNISIEHFRLETLDDVAAAMERIAVIAGKPDAGQAARRRFEDTLADVARRVEGLGRPKVAFITEFRMLGTAGRGTFIDEMIALAGGENVAAKYSGWTNMTAEGLLAARPDVVICQVGSEAEAARAREFFDELKDLPAVQAGRVHVTADLGWTIPCGELAGFTSRLAEIIHPSVAAEGADGD